MCTNLVSLLKSLPSGSSVLECGCGLGGLSEFLTLSGLAVDALDVNETQCSIVKRRLQPLVEHGGPESHVICEDLSSYLSTTDRIYDVILFEASFHHFMNHQDILHEIVSRHMNSSSLILFINEPILKQKTKILPYAWGPRLDGESLFQMRRRGWLELGYTEDYIYEMCHRLNIGIVRFTLPGTRAVSYALSKDQKILDTIGEGYYSLRDYIVNCYRFILGREPESEKVVDKYLESVKSLHCIREKLRKVFLTSEEFKRNL